jgi:hypothetical protein
MAKTPNEVPEMIKAERPALSPVESGEICRETARAQNPIDPTQIIPASADGNLAAHALTPKTEKLTICSQ